MLDITQINENIHRLTVPYKDIFTTVYALATPQGVVLFDAASYEPDVTDYILPFLKAVGISAEQIKYIFISHNHTDHAGGLQWLEKALPHATIVSRSPKLREQYGEHRCLSPEDGDVLLDVFRVVTIPGHTKDCAALLDTRTATLISGDCLQSYGIRGSGTWAANIMHPAEYVEAVQKVRGLDIAQIITAHDYDPRGYRADGKTAVEQNLDACITPLRNMQKLILEYPELDDAALQAKYNYDPRLPKIKDTVIGAMRKAMEEGRIDRL